LRGSPLICERYFSGDEEYLPEEAELRQKKKKTSVLAKNRLDAHNTQIHKGLVVGLDTTPGPGVWWSTVLFVPFFLGSTTGRYIDAVFDLGKGMSSYFDRVYLVQKKEAQIVTF
jgi:hypothetical protein